MHATVDSFSAGIPVVPFAYSRKFEGLYGSLGYNCWVDGCKESTGDAIQKTLNYIQSRDILKKSLDQGLKLIDQKNQVFLNLLWKVCKAYN